MKHIANGMVWSEEKLRKTIELAEDEWKGKRATSNRGYYWAIMFKHKDMDGRQLTLKGSQDSKGLKIYDEDDPRDFSDVQREGGICVGMICFYPFNGNYLLRIFLNNKFQGQGLGKFAVANAIFYILKARKDLKELHASAHTDNIASKNLLLKSGFTYVDRSKIGHIKVDNYVYYIKGEYISKPSKTAYKYFKSINESLRTNNKAGIITFEPYLDDGNEHYKWIWQDRNYADLENRVNDWIVFVIEYEKEWMIPDVEKLIHFFENRRKKSSYRRMHVWDDTKFRRIHLTDNIYLYDRRSDEEKSVKEKSLIRLFQQDRQYLQEQEQRRQRNSIARAYKEPRQIEQIQEMQQTEDMQQREDKALLSDNSNLIMENINVKHYGELLKILSDSEKISYNPAFSPQKIKETLESAIVDWGLIGDAHKYKKLYEESDTVHQSKRRSYLWSIMLKSRSSIKCIGMVGFLPVIKTSVVAIRVDDQKYSDYYKQLDYYTLEIFIHKDYRRQGLGSSAIKSALIYISQARTDLIEVQAIIESDNQICKDFLINSGFQFRDLEEIQYSKYIFNLSNERGQYKELIDSLRLKRHKSSLTSKEYIKSIDKRLSIRKSIITFAPYLDTLDNEPHYKQLWRNFQYNVDRSLRIAINFDNIIIIEYEKDWIRHDVENIIQRLNNKLKYVKKIADNIYVYERNVFEIADPPVKDKRLKIATLKPLNISHYHVLLPMATNQRVMTKSGYRTAFEPAEFQELFETSVRDWEGKRKDRSYLWAVLIGKKPSKQECVGMIGFFPIMKPHPDFPDRSIFDKYKLLIILNENTILMRFGLDALESALSYMIQRRQDIDKLYATLEAFSLNLHEMLLNSDFDLFGTRIVDGKEISDYVFSTTEKRSTYKEALNSLKLNKKQEYTSNYDLFGNKTQNFTFRPYIDKFDKFLHYRDFWKEINFNDDFKILLLQARNMTIYYQKEWMIEEVEKILIEKLANTHRSQGGVQKYWKRRLFIDAHVYNYVYFIDKTSAIKLDKYTLIEDIFIDIDSDEQDKEQEKIFVKKQAELKRKRLERGARQQQSEHLSLKDGQDLENDITLEQKSPELSLKDREKESLSEIVEKMQPGDEKMFFSRLEPFIEILNRSRDLTRVTPDNIIFSRDAFYLIGSSRKNTVDIYNLHIDDITDEYWPVEIFLLGDLYRLEPIDYYYDQYIKGKTIEGKRLKHHMIKYSDLDSFTLEDLQKLSYSSQEWINDREKELKPKIRQKISAGLGLYSFGVILCWMQLKMIDKDKTAFKKTIYAIDQLLLDTKVISANYKNRPSLTTFRKAYSKMVASLNIKLAYSNDYSCTYKPPIPCFGNGERQPSLNSVTKVSKKRLADQEYHMYEMITDLDPDAQYFIKPPTKCTLYPEIVEDCEIEGEEYIESGKLSGLTYEDVPLRLKDIVKAKFKPDLDYLILKNLENVIYAIGILRKAKLTHFDINPYNIVAFTQNENYRLSGFSNPELENSFHKNTNPYLPLEMFLYSPRLASEDFMPLATEYLKDFIEGNGYSIEGQELNQIIKKYTGYEVYNLDNLEILFSETSKPSKKSKPLKRHKMYKIEKGIDIYSFGVVLCWVMMSLDGDVFSNGIKAIDSLLKTTNILNIDASKRMEFDDFHKAYKEMLTKLKKDNWRWSTVLM